MEKIKRSATTAQRLKEAMAISGKKQIDLVNETGMNRSTISRYLSGEFEPKQNAIYKLAKALDVSEMWLWGYDIPMERTKAQKTNDAMADIVVRMRADQKFFSLIERINNLDDTQLKAIETMLLAFDK